MTLTVNNKQHNINLNKSELSDYLGITRVTLNSRLEKGNWKKGELVLLVRKVNS